MGHVKLLTYTKNVMFGLLRKSKFSLEKLSLNSLMLLRETMGISSPVWVPAECQKERDRVQNIKEKVDEEVEEGDKSKEGKIGKDSKEVQDR